MKTRGINLILVLACLWVLWSDGYTGLGWRAIGEYETLSACKQASAETSLMLTENLFMEMNERENMGFFKRLLDKPLYKAGHDEKCLPTGVAP